MSNIQTKTLPKLIDRVLEKESKVVMPKEKKEKHNNLCKYTLFLYIQPFKQRFN